MVYTTDRLWLPSFVTQPNMYARGILFGKMKYELGDHSFVRCPELGLVADVEFKTKGYFGGTYNAIGGTIKNEKGETLFELSGMWSGEMVCKDLKVFRVPSVDNSILILNRLVTKMLFSTLQTLSTHHHLLDLSKNRTSVNLRDCGRKQCWQSKSRTTSQRRRRKPR